MTHTLGTNCTELVVLTPADRARVMADIAGFGFRHVRFEVPWQLVQPRKDVWDWTAVADVARLAALHGIELLPILGVHMAPWKYNALDYGEFCRRAAELLKTPAYELGNEPNLQLFNAFGKADPIVPLIMKGYSFIKQVQPGALIVFPGLAAAETFTAKILWWSLYGNTSPEDFLAAALRLGVGPWFDVMAYHPYAIDKHFKMQLPKLTQPMIARGPTLQKMLVAEKLSRPMWATEWGFDIGAIGIDEAAKRFVVQLPMTATVYERSYLFAWRDHPGHGGSYGLVDANNVPRKPYFDVVHARLRG